MAIAIIIQLRWLPQHCCVKGHLRFSTVTEPFCFHNKQSQCRQCHMVRCKRPPKAAFEMSMAASSVKHICSSLGSRVIYSIPYLSNQLLRGDIASSDVINGLRCSWQRSANFVSPLIPLPCSSCFPSFLICHILPSSLLFSVCFFPVLQLHCVSPLWSTVNKRPDHSIFFFFFGYYLTQNNWFALFSVLFTKPRSDWQYKLFSHSSFTRSWLFKWTFFTTSCIVKLYIIRITWILWIRTWV